MTSEALIKSQIRLDAGTIPGVKLFNNPVGLAYTRDQTGKYTPIRMGLVPGSHDLIGWRSVVVTPDMVGTVVAIFSGIEVKNETGRLRPEQINFDRVLKEAGGLCGMARSPEDARRILGV